MNLFNYIGRTIGAGVIQGITEANGVTQELEESRETIKYLRNDIRDLVKRRSVAELVYACPLLEVAEVKSVETEDPGRREVAVTIGTTKLDHIGLSNLGHYSPIRIICPDYNLDGRLLAAALGDKDYSLLFGISAVAVVDEYSRSVVGSRPLSEAYAYFDKFMKEMGCYGDYRIPQFTPVVVARRAQAAPLEGLVTLENMHEQDKDVLVEL